MTKAGRQMSIQMVGENKTEDDDDNERKNNPTNKSNCCFQRCFHCTLPSKEGARDHAQQQHGKHSWRVRALHFIHRPTVQRILMLLLLLDVLILFAELFLLALYPQCDLVERDCIACCPNELNNNDVTEDERWLATESSPRTTSSPESQNQSDSCDVGYIDSLGEPSCDDHKWEGVHQAGDTFFGMTVAILSLFLVENIVELLALTPAVFFRHVWYLSDFVIVFTSLALELVFHWTSQQQTQETLGGSLVFFRLWRFLRITHGLVEVTSEWTHQQYNDLIEYAREMEDRLLQQRQRRRQRHSQTASLPPTNKRVIRLCHPPTEKLEKT
ncbi:ion transport protein [Nitzschia inconspicua]|uniref:Ion transport protein n=1 Tax=Nitzschia inconspicua TaxID=303405 RepID=A0A9K3LKF1_9STRA|nr:ion transport protein [Nitzschia inconspicua]